MDLLIKILLSFIQIGIFSFGGGLASLPLIRAQVVDYHNWLSLSEFIDLISISEMTPGPIAINAATFVGFRLAGFWGALIATIGTLLPSVLFVSILGFIYFRYKDIEFMKGILSSLRPAIVALILTAGLTILKISLWGNNENTINLENINVLSLSIFIFALYLLRKKSVNPIVIILLSGVTGALSSFFN